MIEQWRDVVGYEGRYQISDNGNVKSFCRWKKGGLLKPWLDKDGYRCVNLYHDKDTHHFHYVHNLILEAFVGLRPIGQQCRHLNGHPDSNYVSNLVWGTPQENEADKLKHRGRGTLRGSKRHGSKLTETDIPKIRTMLTDGVPQRKIAALFNVSLGRITAIKSGRGWSHV